MRMTELQTMNPDGSKCVSFMKRKNEKNFLKIANERSCWSYVGKFVEQRSQTLSLDADKCIEIKNIAHELLHALGLRHEQSRPDRDEWIQVDFQNIKEGKAIHYLFIFIKFKFIIFQRTLFTILQNEPFRFQKPFYTL